MARSLSQRGAQFPRGQLPIGDEGGIATHPLHQPGGAALAGLQVARKMHAAHHALPRVFGRTCQQLRTTLGQHVGQ
jgi:hypothetical protein